ncbi:MAG: hypothetical protein ACQESF_03720, partial [Nanobdellota archaeon]
IRYFHIVLIKVKMTKMASKVKLVLLSVAIAIIFVLFVGYGISTFYKIPKYDDFCESQNKVIESKETCEEMGGKWTPSTTKPRVQDNNLQCQKISEEGDNLTLTCNSLEAKDSGWCDSDFKCRKEYNEAKNAYNKNVFLLAALIGLIGLVIGGIFLKVETVGIGIMGGSILTIIYGVIRYWGEAPDILRFSILGVVLASLIWIGYKKIKPGKK